MTVARPIAQTPRGPGNDDWFQPKLNIIMQNLRLMNDLLTIVQSAAPGPSVQFRETAYGKDGIRLFLRDVIALANAPVEGARYIVVGMGFDSNGQKQINPVDREDFCAEPSYRSLVAEYIEPMITVRYEPVDAEGNRCGVFEIADCQDQPYMMRADHCEKLRRGDAYVRMENMPVKMGRRQLQTMFEKKFEDSITGENVEIGFPGDIIHKDLKIRTVDLTELPSAVASAKIQELMNIHKNPQNRGSTTVISRMLHARLFGTSQLYEDRSLDDLKKELAEIQYKYENEDKHFLFENNTEHLQLVILNQGGEALEDASLKIVMPKHDAFFVARELPMQRRDGEFIERTTAELADYPSVDYKKDSVHISNILGDVPAESPKLAFTIPLRICVGSELKGRKLGIRYTLDSRNLRRPAKGKLRLLF